MDDVEVPIYYVVNPALEEGVIQAVSTFLRITPIHCALISEATHVSLVRNFTNTVLRVDEDKAHEAAKQLWLDYQCRSLVVGEANVIAAVYEDGRKEEIAIQC
jgi:hypothetical protein